VCISVEVPETRVRSLVVILGGEKSDLINGQCGRNNFLRCFADFVYQFGVRYDDQPIMYSRNFEEAVWPLPRSREVQFSCVYKGIPHFF